MTGPGVVGPGPRPARRRRVLAALAVSAALIALVAAGIVRSGDPLRGAGYGALAIASVVVVALLARRSPGPAVAAAAVLSTGATVLATSAGTLYPVPPFALLPFAIAVVLAMVRGAAVWAVASVVAAYAAAVTAVFISDSPVQAVRGVGTMLVVLVALGAGAFIRSRRMRLVEEHRLQADRQRVAIEEERLRIARELHDVLAHSLSSITVQAGVGLHLAGDRPAAAVEALETIRTASREALDEVRGVLGLLRGDESAPLAPRPDLDALVPLVAELRRAGARIALDDRLHPRPALPVQLAVYRVVQEALTNARRHAPGAAIEVELALEEGAAVAAVRDRGPAGAPPPPVAGNGITGMRERAAALGGALEVRPTDDGLEVLLRIPIQEAPA